VPFSQPSISKEEISLVGEVLMSGWLAHGEYNEKFELAFSEYTGANHSLSLNSCTSALELALWINNIKGEVLIPSFTWSSTGNVVLLQGGKPVFVDIEPDTFNISLADAESKITARTEAIIIVHYAGLCADLEGFRALSNKYGLLLVEDSAEALGASQNNINAGQGGYGCFSFYPTKNITTCEGGMLTFKNERDFLHAKALAAHGVQKAAIDRETGVGKEKWYREAIYNGRNFRMPNPLAALGYLQLHRNTEFNLRRNEIAQRYNKIIDEKEYFQRQKIDEGMCHSFQMYSFLSPDKTKHIEFLNQRGIMASSHFDPPLHRQTAFIDQSVKSVRLSATEKVAEEVITLPLYPSMSEEQISYVEHYLNLL